MVSRNIDYAIGEEREKRLYILDALSVGRTFNELVDSLKSNVSRATISRHLRLLEKEGLATRHPVKGSPRVEWRLTEKIKKTSYYRQKLLALRWYLPLYHHTTKKEEIIKHFMEKEGYNKTGAEITFLNQFDMHVGKAVNYIVALNMIEPQPVLISTFYKLLTTEHRCIWGDGLKKYLEFLKKDMAEEETTPSKTIDELLEKEIKEEKYRKLLKAHLFV